MSSTITWTDDDDVLLKYSPGDTITGETFTGPANRTYLDSLGAVRYALVNVKRDGTYVGGVRSLLLEGARTNLIIKAEAFDNAAWTKATAGGGSLPVVTADNGTAPDGNVTAEKVVFAAPVSGDQSIITQAPTVVNATQYAGTVYVKAFAVGDVGKILVYRQVGASTYSLLTLTAAWQRLGTTETSTSTTGNFEIGLRPNQGGSTGTVSIFIWAGDLEAGAFSTSYIPTTTVAVTRTAETYQLPFTLPPQELTVYVKGVEAGTVLTSGAGLFALGGSANASLLVLNTGNKYQALHRTAVDVTSTAAAAPAIGDVVELRICLFGDGSVQLGQSINSAAEVVAAQSVANTFAASWLTQIAYLGDRSGAAGFFNFQSFKIVAGSRSLDEMRAIASPISFSNGRAAPLDRFNAWTPRSTPIGPAETALGTGQRYVFPFRTDHTVSFEIRNIPNTLLWKALKLQDHLLSGGTVSVNTGDSLNSIYTTCCLAPDSNPVITLSDAQNLEYNFSVALLNVAGAPFRMQAVY